MHAGREEGCICILGRREDLWYARWKGRGLHLHIGKKGRFMVVLALSLLTHIIVINNGY